MTLATDKVREALQAAEAEAKRLYADAEKMKEDMVAEGVNPLTDQDAFNKVDEAFKAYSVKSNEIDELQGRLDRLTEIDGLSKPPDRRAVAQRLGLVTGGSGGGSGDLGSIELMQPLSMGRRFVESEEYQALHKGNVFSSEGAFNAAMARGLDRPVDVLSRDEMEGLFRALGGFYATTVTGGGSTSAGPFIQNDLVPGFITYRRKRPLLAAMVGQGTTDSDIVEYVSQSAPTDAAAETAEDTAASESTYAYATNTANVREITHWVPVTLRAMADYGQIRTIIENELAMGALDRLDTQIASGDGTGQNLTGIYNASGIGTQALGGDSRADAVHKAMTQIRVAAGVLSEPDFIGLHPNDYQSLILETDANGQYVFGPPSAAGSKAAWGVPLIQSTVFTEGTPIVGDYAGSAILWLREALSVTSGLNDTDFTQRRISLLAAIRVAFAVTRAGGFCTVTSF